MTRVSARVTTTGGREATTRHIPPKLALAVGMPTIAPPAEWRWSPLATIARLESGHTPSRKHPEYWGGSIPWISIQDARESHGRRIDSTFEHTNDVGIANSSARILPKNTVCLSRTASVGYVVVMGRPMATSQDFVNWVCTDQLNPDFLKYVFIAEGKDLLRFASGSVHQTIYFPAAKAFHICHPSAAEQSRIVAILDEAFEGIATAKVNAEKNLQNARAIFESHLDAVFTQSGDDWVEKSMGELVADGALAKPFDGNHGEIHPRKADFKKAGVPFVMASDLHDGEVDTLHCAFLSRKQADSLRVGFAKDGDVLISHKGTIGRSAIVKTTDDYIMLTPQVTAYRVTDFGKLYNRYIRYFFMSQTFQQRMIAGAADGSTRAYIGITKQLSLRLRFPSIARQKTIASELDVFLPETRRLADIYEKKLIALDALKKSLLHTAFSGELTAKKGADRVEVAA
jgi:type I restriction enzyme, S subunit